MRNEALCGTDAAVAAAGPLKTRERADQKAKLDYCHCAVPEAHLLDLCRVQVKVCDPYAAVVFWAVQNAYR